MTEPHRAHVVYHVPYADTDQMGVVYYANYLVYFERARTQLLRDLGLPYRELEESGYALPVVEAHVNYKASAEYDDTLDIYGWIEWVKRVRLQVNCAVYCKDRLLAEGFTVHAFVNRQTMQPVKVIPELANLDQSKKASSSQEFQQAEYRK